MGVIQRNLPVNVRFHKHGNIRPLLAYAYSTLNSDLDKDLVNDTLSLPSGNIFQNSSILIKYAMYKVLRSLCNFLYLTLDSDLYFAKRDLGFCV